MKTAQFIEIMSRNVAGRLRLLVQVHPIGTRRGEEYFRLLNDRYEIFGWFRDLRSGKRVFQVNRYDIRNHCQVKP